MTSDKQRYHEYVARCYLDDLLNFGKLSRSDEIKDVLETCIEVAKQTIEIVEHYKHEGHQHPELAATIDNNAKLSIIKKELGIG